MVRDVSGSPAHGNGATRPPVELARAHEEFEVLAQTHSLYSALAHLKGDDQAALGHAHHAVEVAEKIGSAFSRVLAYHALGQARMLRGESTAAVDALERALAIGRDRHTARQNEAEVLALLAEARLTQGDSRAARETAEQALTVARERGTRMWECAAHPTPGACAPAGRGRARKGRHGGGVRTGIELGR